MDDQKYINRVFGNSLGKAIGFTAILGACYMAPQCAERIIGEIKSHTQDLTPTDYAPLLGFATGVVVSMGLHQLQKSLDRRGTTIDELTRTTRDRIEESVFGKPNSPQN